MLQINILKCPNKVIDYNTKLKLPEDPYFSTPDKAHFDFIIFIFIRVIKSGVV